LGHEEHRHPLIGTQNEAAHGRGCDQLYLEIDPANLLARSNRQLSGFGGGDHRTARQAASTRPAMTPVPGTGCCAASLAGR
jgi:hypothetical protein